MSNPRSRAGHSMPNGWEDHASCRSEPASLSDVARVDWWHPTKQNANWGARRAICDACPVKAQCLADAMSTEVNLGRDRGRHGMRGGLTPDERIDLALGVRGAA